MTKTPTRFEPVPVCAYCGKFANDHFEGGLCEDPDNRWITWEGGDCPVDGNTLVEVKFDSGEPPSIPLKARLYYWGNKPEYSNIVAYRVVKEDKAETSKKPKSIELTPAEIQSGVDRVKWAEGLIRQLPEDHEGRNSWLLNYGEKEAKQECVSPLTDDELIQESNSVTIRGDDIGLKNYRVIANAAHRAALKWVAELPAKTSLSDEALFSAIKKAPEYSVPVVVGKVVADAAIAEFQAALKKMAGE